MQHGTSDSQAKGKTLLRLKLFDGNLCGGPQVLNGEWRVCFYGASSANTSLSSASRADATAATTAEEGF